MMCGSLLSTMVWTVQTASAIFQVSRIISTIFMPEIPAERSDPFRERRVNAVNGSAVQRLMAICETLKKKELIPDPETAPVVKRIFEMCANGMGVRKICDVLTKENILAPSVYMFQRTGSRSGQPDLNRPYHWAQTTVRAMLSNQEYVGDTVNFKTYSKSNKLKKRLKNAPENILIFRDTHEAIIDRKTFDLVQKHYEGRRRPDKHGETDKYAGYLFCGDCGKRLYLHRAKENVFACAGHKKRTTDCTMHYIRESVLDQIVLHNLRTVTAFARDNPEKFYAMAAQNGEAEAKKFCKQQSVKRYKSKSVSKS